MIKKMHIVLSLVLLVIMIGFNNMCSAQQTNSVIVPRSTVIPAVATMELSSQNLMQGQNVSVTVNNDFYYNNSLVVPLGSSINGTVTMVQKADKNGTDGKFSIAFTNILTPYGNMVPISGMIKTEDSSGIILGNVTKDNTDEIVKNSIKGAVIGSSVSKNKRNNSVTSGTAIGVNLGASTPCKGHPAIISVGTIVDIVLNQQSTFKAIQGYQY